MTIEERLARIETLLAGIATQLERDTWRMDMLESAIHGLDGNNGLKSRVSRLEEMVPSKKQLGIFGSVVAMLTVVANIAYQVITQG